MGVEGSTAMNPAQEICAALGLNPLNVTNFKLNIRPTEIRVEVVMVVRESGKLVEVLKRFKLVPDELVLEPACVVCGARSWWLQSDGRCGNCYTPEASEEPAVRE